LEQSREESRNLRATVRGRDVKLKQIVLVGMLLMGLGLASGCCVKELQPEGALGVSELLAEPVYDTQVTLYGDVGQLGEIWCPCSELTSGGAGVMVWHAWHEDDWPAVSVEGIQRA
jgi:hypothetical protein